MKKKREAVEKPHPIIQKKIDQSLKISIREGSMSSISTGFGLSYLAPFALALSATSEQMGILYAITNLLPSLIQIKIASLIKRFSRKKIVLVSALVRILLWIPIIFTGILFYFGAPHMVWVLISLIAFRYIFIAISNPAWFSWMGSLVPQDQRGEYFSKRNRIIGFFSIITMISGALILDWAKKTGAKQGNILGFTILGFGILFTLAMSFKIWSWTLLKKQYSPKLKVREKDYFTFWQFLKKSPSTPFGKFSLFRTGLSLSVAIATPFWVVYMLRSLNFSYLWYMAITSSKIVFQLLFLPLLGKFSDRFGNIKLTKVCSWLIVSTPFFWLVSPFIKNILLMKIYLLLVPAIVGGFGWAGYNLAVNNYVYDAVMSSKRSLGVAYINLMVGVGIFAGASFGAFLAWFNVSFMNPLLFIFLVSMIVRFIVVAIGNKFLSEVRNVKRFSSGYLIKEFEPIQETVKEIHHLEDLAKKVENYI